MPNAQNWRSRDSLLILTVHGANHCQSMSPTIGLLSGFHQHWNTGALVHWCTGALLDQLRVSCAELLLGGRGGMCNMARKKNSRGRWKGSNNAWTVVEGTEQSRSLAVYYAYHVLHHVSLPYGVYGPDLGPFEPLSRHC